MGRPRLDCPVRAAKEDSGMLVLLVTIVFKTPIRIRAHKDVFILCAVTF